MKKVTVNGVDHELSPDSPRATSHSALLQDIVTAVNKVEVGAQNGVIAVTPLALTSTSANVITTATADANTSSSVAALTIKPTVALTSGDLVLDVQQSTGTSLLKVAQTTGNVTALGSVTATAANLSGTTPVALTGTGANLITVATTDANTSTTTAALTIQATQALTAGDLLFSVKNSAGTSRFNVDQEGYVQGVKNVYGIQANLELNANPPGLFSHNGSYPITLSGGTVSSGTAVATILKSPSAYSAGDKLVSVKNNSTEVAFVNDAGELELTTVSKGIILKSADGTRYRLIIANGGTVSISAA